MAKKKLNIVLLLFVLGLWGTVIYRYASQYLYKHEEVFVGQDSIFSLNKNMQQKDTFEMDPIKRDPFLNKMYVAEEKKVVYPVRTARTAIKKAPIVKNEYFPTVEYYGYIKSNSDGKKELVMIKHNGILMKLKMGEEREGLKILKVFKDSVQISYNKKVFFVKRN